MDTVKMVCTKAHTYNLRYYQIGELIDVKRKDVRVLEALKRAEAVSEEVSDSGNGIVQSEAEVKASLRAEYLELFGKNAAGRMSIDGLKAAIAEKKGAS